MAVRSRQGQERLSRLHEGFGCQQMESDGPTEFGTSPACTLYDVAREAGVSTATVSRVVHGQDRVHPTTRRRVLEVIEALGYVPDGAAQSLAQSRQEVLRLVAVRRRAPR